MPLFRRPLRRPPEAAPAPPPPPPAKAPLDAPGVAYFTVEGAGGRRFFACAPYRASLSQAGCAARWREAQAGQAGALSLSGRPTAATDRFSLCRGCAIGARHAGEEPVVYSRLYGSPVCPRCRRGGARMIGGRVCVSCYNREREMAKGRNARGNLPARLLAEKPLHPVAFRVVVDGRAERRRVALAADLTEPLLQVLRTTRGDIAFAFAPRSTLAQGRLF